MPLVSSSIPNMINGISQQPPEIRLPSQSEKQVNGYSTIARGLEKRPGTEHKQKITDTLVDDTFVHTIRRDRNEEYTMVLTRTSGGVKTLTAYDVDGTQVPILHDTIADVSVSTIVDGSHALVVVDADLSYLESSSVNDNIVATTVADTTFLINKTKTVTAAASDGVVSGEGTTSKTSSSGSTQIAGDYTDEGMIFVKAGDYSSKYVIKIVVNPEEAAGSGVDDKRTYKVGFQTPSSQVGLNQTHIGTPVIAKYLKEGMTSLSTAEGAWDDFDSTDPIEGFGGWRCIIDRDENGETSGAGDYVAGLDAIVTAEHSLAADNFEVEMDDASGSVISIKCEQPFSIEVQDSKGGAALVGIKDEVTSFSSLPGKNVPEGYIVKVVGNAGGSQDDYYVKYEEDSEGVGVWKETLGRAIDTGFDITTMPHRLIRLYDASGDKFFLYEPVKEVAVSGTFGARFGWSSRKAGDDTSNPFPTFVGGKINDITFHKNRFGVLSDENIIFSEAGNYYNFFPISVMTALDGNPIDISVSNNQVSILTHAAAFNQSLLLFSDFQQFSLNHEGGSFSPSTVSVDVVTQFESTSKAPPVSSGRFVYFPFERGEYSGVREYFVDMGTADANDATDITAHIPQYIKGNITKMMVSSNDQMVAVLSDDDTKRIYVYKNYWQDQEKLQNSWSHWTFDGDILNCAFLGSTLKLLVKRDGDGLYLEDINLSLDSAEAVMEDETAVLLDRRVKLVNGDTVADDLPYFGDIPANMVYVTDNARKLSSTTASLTQAMVNEYLAEDATNVVYAGIPYTFEYEFSRFIHKENDLPAQTAKLQIRNINLLYNKTGFFNLKIDVNPGTIQIPDPNVIILPSSTLVDTDATVTVTSTSDLTVGMPVLGTGIPSGTTISSITDLTTLELSANATISSTVITLTFNSGQTISSTPRTNYEKKFSGMVTNTSALGQYKLLSGTFKGGVMSNASNCNITIENDEYLPCSFQSAEWEGFLHQRSRRV